MFGVERRSKILSLLNEKRSIVVAEVAGHFGVVEETIRRDLKMLESQGLLVRTHGGAVPADESRMEVSVKVREGINADGKDAIGREAAKLVNDGDTVILDASTSSLFVARHIKNKKGLTVITNALKIALELAECQDITIISTGGVLRRNSLSFVGRTAESIVDNYYADKLFFSCKGFSLSRGLTDSNEQESDLRRKMIKNCDKAILLCDKTKFDRVGYVTTAKLEDLDVLITDAEISQDIAAEIENANVRLVRTGSGSPGAGVARK